MDTLSVRVLGEGLTYDDVLLIPAYSEILPRDVSVASKFSRNIEINIPIVSAAMDTVTESRLAIAMAQEGGLGIVHKNLTPAEQAEQVAKVKKFESGVIKDPIIIAPETKIRDVIELQNNYNISGLPVIGSDGLVGIVTRRDVRFETNLDQSISSVMTKKDRLVTVKEGESKEKVLELLHQHRIERLLVVDAAYNLKGMITVKDITKSRTLYKVKIGYFNTEKEALDFAVKKLRPVKIKFRVTKG